MCAYIYNLHMTQMMTVHTNIVAANNYAGRDSIIIAAGVVYMYSQCCAAVIITRVK